MKNFEFTIRHRVSYSFIMLYTLGIVDNSLLFGFGNSFANSLECRVPYLKWHTQSTPNIFHSRTLKIVRILSRFPSSQPFKNKIFLTKVLCSDHLGFLNNMACRNNCRTVIIWCKMQIHPTRNLKFNIKRNLNSCSISNECLFMR